MRKARASLCQRISSRKRERARCVSGRGIFRDESRKKASNGYNWSSIFVYSSSQRDSHSQLASQEAGVVPKILVSRACLVGIRK